MAMMFYVNMQKRGDGKVYADLHKTDHMIYFDEEEVQQVLDADPALKPYRHAVEMVAMTADEYNGLMSEIESLKKRGGPFYVG